MRSVRRCAAVVHPGRGAVRRRRGPRAADACARAGSGHRPRRRSGLMDARMLEILACPVCKGTLKFHREAQVLVCRMDRLAYPIRDAVPVMLEEEARQLAADDPLLDR